MATEFVIFQNGREIAWFDPVVEFTETEDAWIVDNGYSTYTLPRGPELTYKIRPMETSRDY